MSTTYQEMDAELTSWLEAQPVFFVATAPLGPEGHVNCSPKGGPSCFRVLGPREVAYQETTGSGIETIAHLRENGRIVLMFCAFQGEPCIVRLHGRGEVIRPGHIDYEALHRLFPHQAGTRSFIQVQVSRISRSCGFGVPILAFQQHRDVLDRWAGSKSPEQLAEYQRRKNSWSIDGLPALIGEFEDSPSRPPTEPA